MSVEIGSAGRLGRVNLHPDEVITDGYHDMGGAWYPTSAETRDRLRAAMGEPGWPPPIWFVVEGTAHRLLGPCELRLESGT